MDALFIFPSSGRRLGSLLTVVTAAALAFISATAAAQVVAVPAALLSHTEGSVAVAPKGDNEWIDVKPRRALRHGDRVWTDRGARAELQAGALVLRLDGQTQVALESVGEGSAQVSLLRGSLALSVGKLAPGENIEVGTPNLALRVRQGGDLRIDVDPQQGTTRVSVMSGAAVVYGEHGGSVDVGSGQRLSFRERNLAKAPTPAFTAVDDFDRWIVARGRAPVAAAAPAAPTVHPDAIARMHREQEALRQAQARRELEELKAARQAARAQRPVVATPSKHVEEAPRIVQVPRATDDARLAAARRAEEERRAAQSRRVQDEERAVQAKKADDERRSAQARRAQEDRRLAALQARRADEERRLVQARREQEQRRVAQAAQAKRAEEPRRPALAKKAEQDKRLAQAKREQQQAQAAGEARRAQLARLQEQAHREEQATRAQRAQREEQSRRQEQARREEESQHEEQARREDESRREAWERRQRALADQWRREHDVWLRTQQPVPVQPARPAPQGVPARRVS